MNLCSDEHDEVCYEGYGCPVCRMEKEMDDKINDLRQEVTNLEEEIDNLDDEVIKPEER